MNKNIPLCGIVPPMITPLVDQDTLDFKGLENLIEHILAGGVHGLFILGTTGEATSLSYKLRNELIKRVCKQVKKRVPVLVGTSDTSIAESLNLAENSYKWGADAVVVAPPFYYALNQEEIMGYYTLLADNLPIPLFLYNIPSLTKVELKPETVKMLSEHSNIFGFKDSSGNLIYFQKVVQLLKKKQGFSLFVGPEELLMHSILAGGNGGVNGGANMFPKLYVDMYNAVNEKKFEKMVALQQRIIQISSSIYTNGDSSMSYLQGVKCALSLLGICNDNMAAPFHAFDNRKKNIIHEKLRYMNLLG